MDKVFILMHFKKNTSPVNAPMEYEYFVMLTLGYDHLTLSHLTHFF